MEFVIQDYIYLKTPTEEIIRFSKNNFFQALKESQMALISQRAFPEIVTGIKGSNSNLTPSKSSKGAIKEDVKVDLNLHRGEYLILDEWLQSHLSSRSLTALTSSSTFIQLAELAPLKIIGLVKDLTITLNFSQGEIIPTQDVSLFSITNLPTSTVIVGNSKARLFYSDFSNAIILNKQLEIHYFIVKDSVRVKDANHLAMLLGYSKLPATIKLVYDSAGYITYIYTENKLGTNSRRDIEERLLGIAFPLPSSEIPSVDSRVKAPQEPETIKLSLNF